MASFRSLIETAFAAYLSDQNLSANIYTGVDVKNKALPCAICQARSAEEDAQNIGNSRVTVAVIVKGKAADGQDAFDELCAAVKDAVHSSELPAALSGESLTVWGQSAPLRIEWDTQDDAWVETLTVEVYAAPTGFAGS